MNHLERDTTNFGGTVIGTESSSDDGGEKQIFSCGNEAMTTTALQQMFEAINLLIPQHEKAAFLEAKERAMGVFQVESDPLRFLASENYNPIAAAQRLVLYWRYRRQIFGERFLLPMNLTGHGALVEEDMVCQY